MNRSINYIAVPGMKGRIVEPVRWFDPNHVINVVCTFYKITVNDLKTHIRTNEVSYRRHVCIWLLNQYTRLNKVSIADIFDQDHSTIVAGIRSIDNKMKVYSVVKEEISEIKYLLITT